MAFFQNIKMETLSEVDKTIYNYLSGNIDKVPYLRVRDVAHEAHTSPSSVMRFIKHIGYESFPEFRLAFREETVTLPDELMGERILSKDNFPADLDERLAKVAQMIINCENIVFFGVGMSAYTCETAARLFAMLGFNTTPYTDNTYPVFQKLNDTSDNIFIALSVTGNTSEVVEIMNGVKNSLEYKSVAITSDPASHLATMSDVVLNYRVALNRINRYQDFTSQIPAHYIIERLLYKVQQVMKKES